VVLLCCFPSPVVVLAFVDCLQLTWTANCLIETYGNLEFGNEHVISYLPLSHMAAQVKIRGRSSEFFLIVLSVSVLGGKTSCE